MRGLPSFFPASFCSSRCHLGTLSLGHGLKAALSANLTALTTDSGHVLGDICRRSAGLGNVRLWGWNLARGNCYSPSGELVWIAWTLAFTDGHGIPIMPQTGC